MKEMKEIKYTRTYIGKDGQERKEYILVGYLFEKEGRISILMNNYINPAALANEKGEVWLNVYEPKQKENAPNAPKTLYKGAKQVQAVADAVNHKYPSQEPKQEDIDTPF